MGFQGSLASVNLGDIFQTLAMNRQTGTLIVNHQGGTRAVWFDQGEIACCDGHDRDGGPLLLNVLTRRSILTPEQAQDIEHRMYQSQQPVRDILVGDGVVPESELDDITASCIEDQVCEIFEWHDGDFEFVDGDPAESLRTPEALDAGTVRLPTQSLVMEAMRRRDEWERIREVIPDSSELFIVDANGRANIRNLGDEHDPDMLKVLRHLDGRRSIDDIAEVVGIPRFDAFAIVSQLVLGGVARARSPQEIVDDALTLGEQGESDLAASMLEHAAARGEHPEVLRPLAEMKLEAGDTPRAVELYLELIARAQDDGDMTQALADLDVVIGINPDDPELRGDRAECLIDLGRIDEAAQAFTAAASAFLQTRNTQQALRCCHRAKDLAPAAPEPHAILAKCYLSDGQTESAVVEYKSLWHTLLSANRPRKALDELTRVLDRDCKFQHVKEQVLEHARGSEAVKTSSAIRLLVYVVILLALGAGAYGGYELWQVKVKQENLKEDVRRLEVNLRRAQSGPEFAAIDQAIDKLRVAITDEQRELSRRVDRLREELDEERAEAGARLAGKADTFLDSGQIEEAAEAISRLDIGYTIEGERLDALRERLADARSRAKVGEAIATIETLWADYRVDEAIRHLEALVGRDDLTPTVRRELEERLSERRAKLASAEWNFRTGETLAAAGRQHEAREFYLRALDGSGEVYREEARKKLIAIESTITDQKIANIRTAIEQSDPEQVFLLLDELRALTGKAFGERPKQALAALELPLMITVDHHATTLAVSVDGGPSRTVAAPSDHRGSWRAELRYPATGSISVEAARSGFQTERRSFSATDRLIAAPVDLERWRTWALDLQAEATAPPVIADGRILITTKDSRFHIVDATTGRENVLGYDNFHTFDHRPVALAGTAYLALGGQIHAVDLASLQRRWAWPSDAGIDSPSLADHGMWVQEHALIPGQIQLFTGSQPPSAIEEGHVVTLAIDGGEPTAYPDTRIDWAATAPPAVVASILYVPAARRVLTFDSTSVTQRQPLTRLSVFQVPAEVTLRPVAATVGGRSAVLITDSAGTITAIDADPELPAADRQLATWTLGGPPAAEPTIDADGRTAYVPLTDGALAAIALDRPQTGLRWRFPTDGRIGRLDGPAAVGRHGIYLADATGRLICLDPRTGQRRWEVDLDSAATGGVATAGGRIYVTTTGRALLCFEEGEP